LVSVQTLKATEACRDLREDLPQLCPDRFLALLGREFLDYAVNPFVGGVYAGDPTILSVRHAFPKLHALEQEHGSLIRGALKRRNTSGGPKGRMFSFPNGLGELPAAVRRRCRTARRAKQKAGRSRMTKCWVFDMGERNSISSNITLNSIPNSIGDDAGGAANLGRGRRPRTNSIPRTSAASAP